MFSIHLQRHTVTLQYLPRALSHETLFTASCACVSFPRQRQLRSIRCTETSHSMTNLLPSCPQVSTYIELGGYPAMSIFRGILLALRSANCLRLVSGWCLLDGFQQKISAEDESITCPHICAQKKTSAHDMMQGDLWPWKALARTPLLAGEGF